MDLLWTPYLFQKKEQSSAVFWVLAILTPASIFLPAYSQRSTKNSGTRLRLESIFSFQSVASDCTGDHWFHLFLIIIGVNQIFNPYLQETFNIS